MRKKLRKLSLLIVILGMLSFVIFQMSSITIWAETQSVQANVDQEVANFSNPAQAAHASNLAAAAAQNDTNVQAAFTALNEAELALQNAIASGDKKAIDEAQVTYDKAKTNAETALAQATGTTLSEISAMRSEGLGWGEIAHELGIHPGVLGLGHTKGKGAQLAAEIQMATARDMQTGLAKGHGMSNWISSVDKGLGLGHTKSNHGGRDNNNIGSHGHGDTHSHGGNHDGGHGGGHGNNK